MGSLFTVAALRFMVSPFAPAISHSTALARSYFA
jgi:hypothetical protein